MGEWGSLPAEEMVITEAPELRKGQLGCRESKEAGVARAGMRVDDRASQRGVQPEQPQEREHLMSTALQLASYVETTLLGEPSLLQGSWSGG